MKHNFNQDHKMKFVSTRIVTNNVTALARFYQDLTGIPPIGSDCYVEIKTSAGILAICSHESTNIFNVGAARPKTNSSIVIEFEVPQVDQERFRLDHLIDSFVMEPTDQPWGHRSMLFRDPDGNLINLYSQAQVQTCALHVDHNPDATSVA